MIDFENKNNLKRYCSLLDSEEGLVYENGITNLFYSAEIIEEEPLVKEEPLVEEDTEPKGLVDKVDIVSLEYSGIVGTSNLYIGFSWPMFSERDFNSFLNFQEFLKDDLQKTLISLLKGIDESIDIEVGEIYPDGEISRKEFNDGLFRLYVENHKLRYTCEFEKEFVFCDIPLALGKAYKEKVLMLLPLIAEFEKHLERTLTFFLDHINAVYLTQFVKHLLSDEEPDVCEGCECYDECYGTDKFYPCEFCERESDSQCEDCEYKEYWQELGGKRAPSLEDGGWGEDLGWPYDKEED